MPAIAHVDLEVDDATNNATSPIAIGSASSALTDSAPTLILAMGHCTTTGGGSAHLDLTVGGARVALMEQLQNFGANNDLHQALSGMAQLAAAYLHVPADGSETMQFRGWCDDTGFTATSCHAFALDLSDIPEDDGRWHEQTANSDTVVSTPTSGWEVIGSPLVVTAPRTGAYLLIVSCEAVPDTTGDAFDMPHVRLSMDGTPIAGSHDTAEIGLALNPGSRGYAHARVVDLTATTEYEFALEANGTDSNGNIGYRRIRLHLIEVARIEDADVIQDNDTAGTALVGTDSYDADVSIAIDPPAARDYLLLGSFQHQSTWWTRARFLADAALLPPDGFNVAGHDAGLGSTADLSHVFGVHVLSAVDSATAIGLQYETGPGATGGAGEGHIGAAAANADGADITVIAIRLQTAVSEIVLQPERGSLRFSSILAALQPGAVTLQPTRSSLRLTSQAPTLVPGPVTLQPARGSLRLQSVAPSIALGTVVLQPGRGTMRFRGQAAIIPGEGLTGELTVTVKIDPSTYVVVVRIDD